MGFAEERALVEAALADDGANDLPCPPVASRLRDARKRLGITESQLQAKVGAERFLCPDLELRDEEIFHCTDVQTVVALAAALESPASVLLFGEEPPVAVEGVSLNHVVERVREKLMQSGLTVEQFGDKIGWDVEPVLQEANALGTYCLLGLRDICSAVSIDWFAVLVELERTGRPRRRGSDERRMA